MLALVEYQHSAGSFFTPERFSLLQLLQIAGKDFPELKRVPAKGSHTVTGTILDCALAGGESARRFCIDLIARLLVNAMEV
ncbi:hypothetical protein ACLM44_12595 [Synechococcus sp. W2B2]|uniref:hypothetical protein n=1 Tax=unclassified Synechococcus TaxID=2626047 RepID=UPI0018DEA8C0|nr:hypothetical protein [Synechococcus sp. WH 7805]